MQKKDSLRDRLRKAEKRVELAEKREQDCKRRLHDMRLNLQRANAISDGSQIMVNALANKIGPDFSLSKEFLDKSKETVYAVRIDENGGYWFIDTALIDRAE